VSPLKNAVAITLVIVGAGSVVASVGLFVARPYLLNGSACDLTIDAIGVDPEGTIQIRYHARIAYHTEVVPVPPIRKAEVTCVARHAWESLPPRFGRWPRTLKDGICGFYAVRSPAPDDNELVDHSPDVPWILAGITLKPGTYRLRPGDELVYFRNQDRDGADLEGRFRIGSTIPD